MLWEYRLMAAISSKVTSDRHLKDAAIDYVEL